MISMGDSRLRALHGDRKGGSFGEQCLWGFEFLNYFFPEFPTAEDCLCFILQNFSFDIRFLDVFIFPETIMINVLESRKVLGLTMNQGVTVPPTFYQPSPKGESESFNRKWKRIVNLT